jgi:hypothetical protein
LVQGFDLFEFYRFMLAVLVGIYGTGRLVTFIWQWQAAANGWLGSAVLRRYVVVLLLRMRFRRFAYELATIGGLLLTLGLLIHAHWH